MPVKTYPIEYLIVNHLQQRLTADEKLQLDKWLEDEDNRACFEKLIDSENIWSRLKLYHQSTKDSEEVKKKIMRLAGHSLPPAKVVKLDISKRKFWVAAAAILIVLAGSYIFYEAFSGNKSSNSAFTSQITEEIKTAKPASNKALLKMANNSVAYLDSFSRDTTYFDEKNIAINIVNDEVSYNLALLPAAGSNYYHTLSTPRGGKCKLHLSDGTFVILNAGSSIRYPVTFNENERIVELNGEAYFEVAKNPARPFKVNILNPEGGKTNKAIEVLGTHFNVNAYNDGGVIKTTLLEGSVKVKSGNNNLILKTGEQALITDKGNITLDYRFMETRKAEAVDWKEDKFDFRDLDIRSVMLDISRWYNVDVKFDTNLPEITFDAEISRSRPIEEVLEIVNQKKEIKLLFDKKTIFVTKSTDK